MTLDAVEFLRRFLLHVSTQGLHADPLLRLPRQPTPRRRARANPIPTRSTTSLHGPRASDQPPWRRPRRRRAVRYQPVVSPLQKRPTPGCCSAPRHPFTILELRFIVNSQMKTTLTPPIPQEHYALATLAEPLVIHKTLPAPPVPPLRAIPPCAYSPLTRSRHPAPREQYP